jgi:hypothetical protein
VKTAFKEGVRVRGKGADRISRNCRSGLISGYEGEGFYKVATADGTRIVHEDDVEISPDQGSVTDGYNGCEAGDECGRLGCPRCQA